MYTDLYKHFIGASLIMGVVFVREHVG